MRTLTTIRMLFFLSLSSPSVTSAQWAAPVSPVIPQADGYIAIPDAAVMPDKSSTYRAIFDATRAAEKPTQLVPALNMAGSELNLLGAVGVPPGNTKFVIVFHGPALDALLDHAQYKSKYGVDNPNLGPITEMMKAGVELYVCGQNLAFENIDPKTLTPDVAVAVDGLIVLMTYQNRGFALLSF